MSDGSSHQIGFFDAAEAVVRPLCQALRDLVGDGATPQGLRPDLKIHPTLRSRALRGLESSHLPTILYHLPGADGLRRLVDAARRSGADADSVRACRERIDDYEEFLRREKVSRDALHAMVSGHSPEARQSVVRTNAQAVHKAMSNLIGYRAEVMVTSILIIPGTTSGFCDLAQVCGFAGVQHLRTNAWFMTSGYGRAAGEAGPTRTLSGDPVSDNGPTTLLEEFCSRPLPNFKARHYGRRLVHRLEPGDAGLRASSSFYFGERVLDAYPDPPEPTHDSPGRAMFSSIIATPCKRLHFDVLVHRDVWRGHDAHLDIFRTVPHGPVDAHELAERAADRIDLDADLERFEFAPSALGGSKVSGYEAMVRCGAERAGVNIDHFRLYRCEMVYPLYGAQIAMRFETDGLAPRTP